METSTDAALAGLHLAAQHAGHKTMVQALAGFRRLVCADHEGVGHATSQACTASLQAAEYACWLCGQPDRSVRGLLLAELAGWPSGGIVSWVEAHK